VGTWQNEMVHCNFFLKLLILAKMKKHSIGKREREREKAKHKQGMAKQNILTGNREQ
jgi:hypothetical protein